MKDTTTLAREIGDARAEWLEDALAGLMAAGCAYEDIQVQHHPGARIVVCVKGAPKYEWTLAAH